MTPAARAAVVDPGSAKGKRVFYVHNQTKLEKAKASVPAPEPKRLAALEAWRRNDNHAIAYLESLGFIVTKANESTPVDAARPLSEMRTEPPLVTFKVPLPPPVPLPRLRPSMTSPPIPSRVVF